MSSKTKDFVESTQNYLNEMQKPWGKIFYQLVTYQLEHHLHDDIKTVLDIGCGFGTIDRFFAEKKREVTGVDMTPTLLDVAREWAERDDLQIKYEELNLEQADVTAIAKPYDMVVCHNVLEYVADAKGVVGKLAHWVKPGGTVSLIMHNIDSKVLKTFYWNEDPVDALGKLDNTESYAVTIGTSLKHYPLDQMRTWLEEAGLELVTHYGVRCLYDYKHTDKKFDEAWHEQTFELEKAICERSPFRDIATMRHLILRKK